MDQREICEKDEQFIYLIDKYKDFQEVIMNISNIRNLVSEAHFMIENQQGSISQDLKEQPQYKYLEEMDVQDYKIDYKMANIEAPLFQVSELFQLIESNQEELSDCLSASQFKSIANLQDKFKQLRAQIYQYFYFLKQSILETVDSLEIDQNINVFPMKIATDDQMYSLISSLIKNNITNTQKLVNVSFDPQTLYLLNLIIRFLKVKQNINKNHFLVVMSTFAIELQNTTLSDNNAYFRRLFYSHFYFNLQNPKFDTEVQNFDTFIRMHKGELELKGDKLQEHLQNNKYFQEAYEEFNYTKYTEQPFIDALNNNILPHCIKIGLKSEQGQEFKQNQNEN